MALKILPFGAFEGFSDQPIAGTHYYSQGFTPTLYGMGTLYSIKNKIDSSTVSTMGNIKYYASGPGGAIYAQDDAGHILKETTPGAFDFAIVRSPGGNGAGLMGDQYGNLLYANGSTNNQLGLYDGTLWTDNYQSLNTTQHPMDTYEDLRLFANLTSVACLFSDGTFNSAAFQFPSNMTVAAVKGGPTGILIGANFGYQGALVLWDGIAIDSKTPWKWTKGQILSIDKYGDNWIVKTQREVLITNGYTVKQLFGVFDDPLSFKGYDNSQVLPQQMTVVNDMLVFAITSHSSIQSYEFGKMKPGIYLYSLSRKAWGYIPVATGNTVFLNINSVFADINFNNRIIIGYRDPQLGVNYIASLEMGAGTRSIFVSEALGVGRAHGQRVYFGPTEKSAEAVVLNLQPLNSLTDPATLTFNVALKIYNFKRQLWGHSLTNASLTNQATLQVDGSSASNYKTQKGDEVTILEGVNAGQIAHITTITNAGTSSEIWTLDTTLTGKTESGVNVQVQPFTLVKKQTFTGLDALKKIFFSINSIKGKQFLAKFVIDGLGANLGLEMQTSYFVFDDLGYDQT